MLDKQISLAKHCIGLDQKKPYIRHGKKFYKPYRNYYEAGGQDIIIWLSLCELGYVKKYRNETHTFYLTRRGLDWLGKELGIYIYNEEE